MMLQKTQCVTKLTRTPVVIPIVAGREKLRICPEAESGEGWNPSADDVVEVGVDGEIDANSSVGAATSQTLLLQRVQISL
jgi:hypothetical protein